MKQDSSFSTLVFVLILGLGTALVYARYALAVTPEVVVIWAVVLVAAFVVSSAIRVADQWDRVVVPARSMIAVFSPDSPNPNPL